MTRKRIAILHDSPGFGGHEIAFLQWLPAVLDASDVERVDFYIHKDNASLLAAVSALSDPKLHITKGDYAKGPAETFLAPLRYRYGRSVGDFVQRVRPDIVLMLQGRIESLSTPMLWLPRSLNIVSYIPMAHSSREMGRPALPSALLDGVKRLYYRRPKRFITISSSGAEQLRRAGVRTPIHIVENVPNTHLQAPLAREYARQKLGLKPESLIALAMGRFDLHQKGLDRLIRDLRRDADRLTHWTFLFVGGGPGEDALKTLFADTPLSGRVIPWTSEPALYLAASDVVLLPSRFEGVPLMLLDAMAAGKPVLASDIDVFREYLPSFMLRNFDQPVDLKPALEDLSSSKGIKAYHQQIKTTLGRLSLETSSRRFVEALLATTTSPPPR